MSLTEEIQKKVVALISINLEAKNLEAQMFAETSVEEIEKIDGVLELLDCKVAALEESIMDMMIEAADDASDLIAIKGDVRMRRGYFKAINDRFAHLAA